MNVLFSMYHRETKSPKDQSYLCSFDWNKAKDDSIVQPQLLLADGRVSGLYRYDNTLWCCIGTGIRQYDIISKTFNSKVITHPLINQMHSLHVTSDRIYLTSTGMDLLLIFDHAGNLLNSWHPEHKTNRSHIEPKDYREVPYKETGHNIHHLNHVVCNDEYIFVNCGKTATIFQLTHNLKLVKAKRFRTTDSATYITHDGLIIGDEIIFTEACGVIWRWNFRINKVSKLDVAAAWLRGLSIYKGTYILGVTSPDHDHHSKIVQTSSEGKTIKSVKLDCPFQPMVYSVIPCNETII